MTTRQLRDYQVETVAAIRAEWVSGITRTAIVAATGLGKGDLIASMCADEVAAGGRVLVLTHRAEIMGQLAARCLLYGCKSRQVGQVQAQLNQLSRAVTVAMVPTLAARLRAVRVAEEVASLNPQDRAGQRNLARRLAALPQKPTMVICDEVHHVCASTWISVLSWAGCFDGIRMLGVTATLTRGDKKGLGDVIQSVADERGIDWAIERDWLVKPRGRAVVTDHVDLEHAKVSKGDYQDGELGEMVEQDTAQIVKAWIEHAALPSRNPNLMNCSELHYLDDKDKRHRPTVAFCPTVASATALRDEFYLAGIPAGLVIGTTPQAERTRTYAKLATGEINVLCSVMVPTEGWDSPPVSCILQCRPTRLPGLYQQMIGRGLRPHTESGKTDCLVLDVVGASRYQKLATLVDLHKSAEYDDSELKRVCKCCGDIDCLVCPDECAECERRLSEDNPGGGGTQDSGRRRLIGPAQYEDVDLFASSELAWLFTKAGTRFLPAGDRIAILWANGDEQETYAVGHCSTKPVYDHTGRHHDDRVISLREDLDYGRRLAESWALNYAPVVARRGASWRTRGGRPSDAQVGLAASLGITSPETMNKPRLSDEISIVIASRILD
jgi:superfamily II DNA or RNA helicase